MRTLPKLLLNTLVWGQGAEMAPNGKIAMGRPDMWVGFCDSRSPWQYSTNENTNGLPSQYPLPPKTKQPVRLRKADLDTVDEELERQTQRDNPRTAHHQPT